MRREHKKHPILCSLVESTRVPVIDLGFDNHRIKCPHCQKETAHLWPGRMILFSTVQCIHCNMEFLVVLNQSQREKNLIEEDRLALRAP